MFMVRKLLNKKALLVFLTLGIIGGATYPFLGSSTVSMIVDGKEIVLSYTGDETGESLLIYTEQKDYIVRVPTPLSGNPTPPSTTLFYFAIKNTTAQDQQVRVVFSSKDSAVPLSVHRLAGVEQKLSATTSKMENTNKTVWELMPTTNGNRALYLVSKKPVEGNSKETVVVSIPAGGIEYFKVLYKISLDNGQAVNFFLEAFGQNAYGHSE